MYLGLYFNVIIHSNDLIFFLDYEFVTFIGCFTNREEFIFYFKLYDGLLWPNLTQSDFFALAIVNHICWCNVGKTL